MTALSKLTLSLLLLGAGFGLASLFGPPELADRLADTLRPGDSTRWGALKPADASSLADDEWQAHEAAAVHQPDWGPAFASADQRSATTPQPEARGWAPVADPAVRPAVAESGGEASWVVPAAGWRDSTAPVGWPTPDAAAAPRRSSPVTPLGPEDSPFSASPPIPITNAGWGANTTSPNVEMQPPSPAPWPMTAPASQRPPLSVAGLPYRESDEPVRHVVGDGDTLARIAERYLGDPLRADEEVFAANRGTLQDPDLLPIGAELVIPPADPASAPGLTPVAPIAPATAQQSTPHARLLSPRPVAPGQQFAGP